MKKEELKASEMLLDLGVSIPVRPLRFFSKKGKPRKVVIRRPYLGGLIRIARKYLSIGVTYEEMKEYSLEQNMEFISTHGKTASEIVACAIVRGYLSYLVFGKAVAWYLCWRVHPVMLSEAMFQLLSLTDLHPFRNIISSAGKMNLLKPRLSH